MRISDWSSDVCSSDLRCGPTLRHMRAKPPQMPQKGLCIGKARLNSKVEDVRLMSARRHCAKRRNGRICGHGFLQPADAVRRAPLVKASFRQGGERQMATRRKQGAQRSHRAFKRSEETRLN